MLRCRFGNVRVPGARRSGNGRVGGRSVTCRSTNSGVIYLLKRLEATCRENDDLLKGPRDLCDMTRDDLIVPPQHMQTKTKKEQRTKPDNYLILQ